MRNDIIVLLVAFVLPQFVHSSCNYIESKQNRKSEHEQQQDIEIELNEQVVVGNQNLGYGLWFKYQPFRTSFDIDITTQTKDKSKNSFVYLLEEQESKSQILLFYIQFSSTSQIIKHHIHYQFQTLQQEVSINFDILNYEGKWILFYFYFNYKTKKTTIAFIQEEQLKNQKIHIIDDVPSLSNIIRHIVGGTYILEQDQGSLILSQFQGNLSQIFSEGDSNIFSDENYLTLFIQNCKMQNQCVDKAYKLTYYNQEYRGFSFTSETTSPLEYPIYTIQGWVRIKQLQIQRREMVIIRITINHQQNDDFIIGDKELYLKYYLDQQPDLNGLSITTYSYEFPSKTIYLSTNKDIIKVTGAEYQQLLVNWHYILYEIGTINNENQGLLQIYFPSQQNIKLYRWEHPIHHFSGTTLNCYIGGDKYSKDYMIGYLYDLILNTYCSAPIIKFIPKCHYSCLTCNGPNYNNCLTCPIDSNRIISINQNTCPCKLQYVDIKDQINCEFAYSIYPSIRLFEKQLECKQSGYQFCDLNNQICSQGYFLYNSVCLKCPGHFDITKNYIFCSNCIFQPEYFSIALECFVDIIQQEYSCNTKYRSWQEITSYVVINNQQNELELKLNDYQYGCNDGYFLNFNNTCLPCLESCSICQNLDYCIRCFTGYYLSQEFQCESCIDCQDCQLIQNSVVCSSCYLGTFLNSNGICASCGQNCANCDNNRKCYYCDDPKRYFLTMDGQNCQQCSIENCIYCYQYYVEEGLIYSTLDINIQYDQKYHSILNIGCALCENNYYFNQITLNCELFDIINEEYNTNNQCNFGLITDNQGSNHCLISLSQNTSTQTAYCSQLYQCIQCISNYSKERSFCIICDEGYYSSILTGECYMCDYSCKTCIQQSMILKDYWKWEIKAYYKYVLNSDDSHPFEEHATPSNENEFELICTQCQQDYILYEHQCIKDCDYDCTNCQIIDGLATCLQCPQDNAEIKKSKYQQKCDQFENCYYKAVLAQNIYCSLDDYEIQLNSKTETQKLDFQNTNIYIDNLFSVDQLELLFTDILKYLDDSQVREVEFQYTLIQGNATKCLIRNSQTFSTSILVNYQQIAIVDLKFIGNSTTTILEFQYLNIIGFTSIRFEMLNFNTSTMFQMITANLLELNNCVFLSINQFAIYPTILYLDLNNIEFRNLNWVNLTIFDFVTRNSQISLYQIQIKECNFENSSLFYLYPKSYHDINNLKINGISIFQSKLFNSFIIKGIMQNNFEYGNIIVDYIKLEDVRISNQSSVFQVIGATSFKTCNIIIIDCQFFYQSYFYQSNIIQIQDINIKTIEMVDSILFSNKINEQDVVISQNLLESVFIIQSKIENVQYNRAQSIIQIVQLSESYQFNVKIQQFYLSNCTYTIKNMQNLISYNQSIIYVECYYCQFSEFKILRGYGLPEFTILNSRDLQINNVYLAQMDQYYFKTLHSSLDCVQNYSSYQMSYYLYIGLFQNITITNLFLNQSIAYNYPFIIFRGFDLMDMNLNLNILIKDSKFDSNMLIITRPNMQTSIISIQSELNAQLIFNNISFYNNHLNCYFQDTTKQSASTFFVSLQQGFIRMFNSAFNHNLVTNSTDSIMYIKAASIEIQNATFESNNIISLQLLSKKLLLFNQIDTQALRNIFPINSKSGNGILIATNIILNKLTILQSYSNQGGGFTIITQSTSIIDIQNSYFSKALTSLSSSSNSVGGCIYIDAQLATLKLIITNTIFDKCFSRKEGGGLFIIPSSIQNNIQMKNLKVTNCFSIQNTFFSYSLFNLEKANLEVYLSQIDFIANAEGFDEFVSLLEIPTFSELDTIRSNNPIIMFKYGNINIVDCNFYSIHIQSLFKMESSNNVVIKNIRIINSTILNSPLIKVSLRNSLNGEIILNNLTIINITEYQSNQNFSEEICPLESFKSHQSLICQSNKNSILQLNLDEPDNSFQKQQLECNQNKIYQKQNYNFSLVEIQDINDYHHIKAQNLIFDFINCPKCQHGLISLLDIQQIEKENILFQNVKIRNSVCGYTGCLSIQSYWNESTLKPKIIPYNLNGRILQQNDYNKEIQLINHQVKIVDSLFLNSSAIYGGSLFIFAIQVVILNCRFQNNSAIIGGAIYSYSNQTNLFIFNSQLIDNSAQIAGGIFLNQQSIQKTKELNVIILNNTSKNFGQDIFESPRSLTLSVDGGKTLLNKKLILKNSTKIIEQIEILPYKILGFPEKVKFLTFPSGQQISSYHYFDLENLQFIPYNLTFRIIPLNRFNHQMKEQAESFCFISYNVINLTDNKTLNNIPVELSQTKFEFNQITGDFNLDNLTIVFNPLADQNTILRLTINCNNIKIPQYDSQPPYQINNYITDYDLIVDIKTYKCQLGEYLNTTSGSCTVCDPSLSQYSVKLNAQNCNYKEDQKMKSIKSSMIELRSGYWRAYYYSDKIENCYHDETNCKGGWEPGFLSCQLGHIGALCEQCDLYNIRGDGHYSVNSAYKCGNCNQIVDNVLTICLISIWTLISIFLSVLGTIRNIEDLILGIRLKSLKIYSYNQRISTAILIKVFTNYLQIISTITTFQLQVPNEITSIINSIGNPIDSMAYSFDCFLISISDILIIYLRIIWSLITAGSLLAIFLIVGGVVTFIKLFKFKLSFISTALLYIFIYIQPNLIRGLISLISYRRISNELWIQGNVTYRYDTISHFFWLLSFCSPLIFLFALLFPAYFFYKLNINKSYLDKAQMRQIWGYLYNEFKQRAYFWEIVKIFQKELIIIVLAYFEDHITIKASLVFLCLFAYIYFTNSSQPYYYGNMNQLDRQSIIICAITIILGSQIYVAQQSDLIEIIWPFYIIIVIINGFFIIKIVLQILFSYFNKLNDQIDKFRELIFKYFPNLIQKANLYKYDFFKNKRQQKAKIKDRFAKIREYLIPQAKFIIQYRKNYKTDVPIQNKSDSSLIQSLYTSNFKLSPVKSTQNQQSYLIDQLDDQKNSFLQLLSSMQASPDLIKSPPKESSKIIHPKQQ